MLWSMRYVSGFFSPPRFPDLSKNSPWACDCFSPRQKNTSLTSSISVCSNGCHFYHVIILTDLCHSILPEHTLVLAEDCISSSSSREALRRYMLLFFLFELSDQWQTSSQCYLTLSSFYLISSSTMMMTIMVLMNKEEEEKTLGVFVKCVCFVLIKKNIMWSSLTSMERNVLYTLFLFCSLDKKK